jgi:hypothetical protein
MNQGAKNPRIIADATSTCNITTPYVTCHLSSPSHPNRNAQKKGPRTLLGAKPGTDVTGCVISLSSECTLSQDEPPLPFTNGMGYIATQHTASENWTVFDLGHDLYDSGFPQKHALDPPVSMWAPFLHFRET